MKSSRRREGTLTLRGAAATCLAVAIAGILTIGCSVATLQAGLEEPTPAVLSDAESATARKTNPPPIESYERLVVRGDASVSITVYARESENAVANVLFVHGAGAGAWAWEIFFDAMPIEFNLYALSWRGHFDSSSVQDADANAYVEDQAAVANAIAERNELPTHIVGHSYGGATAALQAARSRTRFASLVLLAPVVPLDYTWSQRMVIPWLAPMFIERKNETDGVFGGVFLSKSRMQRYFDLYAGKRYSDEKPGLIGGDGVSVGWQEELADAYRRVASRRIPTVIYVARYDNVVVPRRQHETASANGFRLKTLDVGHYVPLDVRAPRSARDVAEKLRRRSYGFARP